MPDDTPAITMADLALALDASATTTQAQITKDRISAEWRTKMQATRAPAPPCGVFAQAQTELL